MKKYIFIFFTFFYCSLISSTFLERAWKEQNDRYKIGIGLVISNFLYDNIHCIFCLTTHTHKNISYLLSHYVIWLSLNSDNKICFKNVFNKDNWKLQDKTTPTTLRALPDMILGSRLLYVLGAILAYSNYKTKS